MTHKLKILMVGGPDVDHRLELMHHLKSSFELAGVGSNRLLAGTFAEAGFDYHHFPMVRSFNPAADAVSMLALWVLFRREKPDIVHTYDTKPSVVGRLAARLAGVPVVIGTITGLGSLYVMDNRRIRVIRALYELTQKAANRVSDLTIFYNQDDASHFLQRKLIRSDKVAVVPGSGVSLERFSPAAVTEEEKNAARQELNILPDQIVVTMIARLVRSKGVFEFAEVARRVQAARPSIRFVLVGSEDPESMDGLSSDEVRSLQDHVLWIGPRQDIAQLLAISDMSMLPAKREGMPRALVEAAAMGLPLVASRVPGCSEVVQHGKNGFLVEPDDITSFVQAITQLADDPKLREAFGAASGQSAQTRFSLAAIGSTIHTIYERHAARQNVIPVESLVE